MFGRACSPVSGPILLSGETVSRSCTVHSIECLYLESRKFHSSAFLSSSGVKATSLFQVFRATAAIVAIAAARSVKTKCNCAFRAWRSYDVYLFRFVCDLVSPVSATCQWIYIFSFFFVKSAMRTVSLYFAYFACNAAIDRTVASSASCWRSSWRETSVSLYHALFAITAFLSAVFRYKMLKNRERCGLCICLHSLH